VSGQRLRGRVALVTGGASGIGLEIARRFAAEGADVAMLDLARQAETDLLGIVGDAADPATVAAAVATVRAELGPLDTLVNNAWGGEGEAAIDTTDEQWAGALRGTLTSAFVCTRAVLPGMIAGGRGAIVNIASVNGVRFGGHDGYSAAKAGLLSLTRSIAARHGRDGVRANAIVLGSVATPAWHARAKRRPQIFDELLPFYPLGRLGTSGDVASAALFLASDEAGWITGAELAVDGGFLVANGTLAQIAEGHHND
jgi:meso-butanediol dehydrogenase/(S,S)-butanediol dehydrogenase/diacetyl reductase